MSEMRAPAGSAPASFSERFFWLIAALASLALGGFVYVASLMFSSPYKNLPATPAVAVSKAPASEASKEVKVADAPVAREVKAEAPKAAEPAPAPAVAAPAAPASDAPASDSELSVPKKPDAPDVNPYMVPENKPFLSHDMFEKKPQPGAAKPAVAAAAPAKPKVPGKPDEKPKTTLASRTIESSPVSSSTSVPAFRGKIYVLRDGRRIPTVSTVDLGDSYGVKDLNSSYITIPKADVSEVVNR